MKPPQITANVKSQRVATKQSCSSSEISELQNASDSDSELETQKGIAETEVSLPQSTPSKNIKRFAQGPELWDLHSCLLLEYLFYPEIL